jgi:CRP-like cAMP-binding protein
MPRSNRKESEGASGAALASFIWIMAFDQSPENVARILSHSRLFYGMPPASLYDLISHSRFEQFDAGTEDTSELRPNELRVILEGDLHFSLDGSVLGRGNSFGETALLDLALAQEFDSLGVFSASGCTCLVINAAEIRGWLQRHTQLEATLYRHLSQELFNRCLGVSTGPAIRRVGTAGVARRTA